MPKICYVRRNFSDTSLDIIMLANRIIEEYQMQGYDLTLRQLYYQFVARDLFPDDWIHPLLKTKNTDANYKKLGSIINDARLAGEVDWRAITDHTRNLQQLSHWDSPRSIVEACASQYREDLWIDQPWYVEVWVEKDALINVLEKACNAYDVPYFSCRGYTSQSEMWVAAQRLIRRRNEGKDVKIIHLGDHDPSGIDMTRDIGERLSLFCHKGVRVDRIALTMDQVRRFNPPPNPAKISDSRCAAYIRQYGDESWELDALDPRTITSLINQAIEQVLDYGMLEAAKTRMMDGRKKLLRIAESIDG